jgi:hypothetical protein
VLPAGGSRGRQVAGVGTDRRVHVLMHTQPERSCGGAPREPAAGSAYTIAMVPNKPKTPMHPIRIPEELWVAARQVANARGESVSDVVRRALRDYVMRAKLAQRTSASVKR